MYNMDQQVLNAVRHWAREGFQFALVTVVSTWGSAPRPPGSWMALREDGQLVGSVSGGCIEDDLIERFAGPGMPSTAPFLIRYGVTKDEASRFGLPCGGTMELLVEPRPDLESLELLAERIGHGRCVQRIIEVGDAQASVQQAEPGAGVGWDGVRLTTTHGPDWRILIIGAGQLSEYLARMALALGYKIVVCDPRSEYAAQWDLPGTTLLDCMPDDAATELRLDPHTAVLALTHDPKLDDLVLLEALKSPAFYVGALGSAVNSERRRRRLEEHFELSAAQTERLHGPVGLAIGSRTPPEIAVAILAEMTAVRNGTWTREGLRRPSTGVPERLR